jgi:urea transport system ATP-binding protein
MLEARDIDQFYGSSHILRRASLAVPAGSCTCILGRNGVGKTTLLRAIMGLLPIRSGRVLFDGADLTGRDPSARARLGVGYVPQGRDVFPDLSVEENLAIGRLLARGRKGRAIPEIVFRMFPVLRTMLRRRAGDLSGGQQQQLAIGRALALEPKCIVLDEPTEGIQPSIVQELGIVIQRLHREEGISVLLVEQKLPFARLVAETFFLMDRGAVVASGAMTALSDDLVRRHLSV